MWLARTVVYSPPVVNHETKKTNAARAGSVASKRLAAASAVNVVLLGRGPAGHDDWRCGNPSVVPRDSGEAPNVSDRHPGDTFREVESFRPGGEDSARTGACGYCRNESALCPRPAGAEKLDVRKCLKTVDDWAKMVRFDADRHYYRFQRNPAEFSNSEGEYRIMMLVTVLQQDCGVHYHMERVTNVDFRNAKDLFIHGMTGDKNGGTCVSMPVLYTAVARRLGWPVKLALAKGHVFCRWEDGKERFDIEATTRGFVHRDDAYFKKWPHPISDGELKAELYLKSLTPAEELRQFSRRHGHCFDENGRLAEAHVAYALAHQLAPKSPEYFAFLVDSLQQAMVGPSFHRRSHERIPHPGLGFDNDHFPRPHVYSGLKIPGVQPGADPAAPPGWPSSNAAPGTSLDSPPGQTLPGSPIPNPNQPQ